jgi:hypothetical protein
VSDKIKIVMRMTRYTESKEKCTDWAAPVRPVRSSQHTRLGGTGQTGALSDQTGQVQSAHKAIGVRAIWSKMIRPGLQAGLDHLAPFSQHNKHHLIHASQSSNKVA